MIRPVDIIPRESQLGPLRLAIVLAGGLLVVWSLVGDLLVPPRSRPSWTHAGMALLGLLLASLCTTSCRWGKPSKPLQIAAAAVAVACLICLILLAYLLPVAGARAFVLTCLLLGCLLLPPVAGLLIFIISTITAITLSIISDLKVDLTGMPITALDIRLFAGNPSGLWDALSLERWSLVVLQTLILVFIAVASILLIGATVRSIGNLSTIVFSKSALSRSLAVSVIAVAALLHFQLLFSDLKTESSTWHIDRVTAFADRIGIIPFILYSLKLESESRGAIYSADPSVSAPSAEDVARAADRLIGFKPASEQMLRPNIVFVLAESTFDPSSAFHIQGEWNNWLFTPNSLTAAVGPLRVNTRGGGTWVAEFETITGLDSRLFGYAGGYTHSALAPYVEQSFTTYLERRGYSSWAFLGNGGDFYNARNAYESYGFDNILDSGDLGSGQSWFTSDQALVEKVIDHLGSEPSEPLFAYVVLIENHGPHDCESPPTSKFSATFSRNSSFERDCQLEAYLERLGSTTRAIQSLLAYLESLENSSGHPYVLIVFGDHQPYSFTGTGDDHRNFSDVRRGSSWFNTFFHVMSSLEVETECCSTPLPVAALPTLASTFVADSHQELFVGENIWLYEFCGADAIAKKLATNLTAPIQIFADSRSPECRGAFRRALAAYREANLIRLPD